jgi:hypothetical protein
MTCQGPGRRRNVVVKFAVFKAFGAAVVAIATILASVSGVIGTIDWVSHTIGATNVRLIGAVAPGAIATPAHVGAAARRRSKAA